MQSNNRLNNQQIHNKLILIDRHLKDVHFNNRLTNQRLQSSVKSIEKEKEKEKNLKLMQITKTLTFLL